MKTSLSNQIRWGSIELAQTQIPNPIRESNLIMQFVMEKSITTLSPDLLLTKNQKKQFQKLILRRQTHEPYAYLTGKVIFCDQPISVSKHVLIPRPETEILVDLVANHLLNIKNYLNLQICDIGTGSGAISIALTQKIPDLKIIATDKYSRALKIAKKNITNLNLDNRIKLIQGDLLSPFPDNSLEIIIANLPYIPTATMNDLDKTVKDFEPNHALFSGSDGLSLIKKLLRQASGKAKNNATIFLEIWPDQVSQLQKITKQYLSDSKIEFIPDLSGTNRFAKISFQTKPNKNRI